MKPPTCEADVEKYLVDRAVAEGCEVRKARWIGRSKAPDRVLMGLKRWPTVWVELKHPDTGHLFPSNAHEEAQAREHARMRAARQQVIVVWTYEQVDFLMKGNAYHE